MRVYIQALEQSKGIETIWFQLQGTAYMLLPLIDDEQGRRGIYPDGLEHESSCSRVVVLVVCER